MSQLLKLVVAISLILSAGAPPAAASLCRRHFYNNSNYNWSVQMLTPNGCGDGNIFSKTCNVRPHSTLALHYNSITTPSAIIIRSPVYARQFVVTMDCKIQHSGRTGNASVNDPANGDVSTCSGMCR